MFSATMFLLAVGFSADPGIQTDWSGGSGQPGPVEQWTDFYDQSNKADHDTPGELTIQTSGDAAGFLQYQEISQGIGDIYSIDAADLNGDGLVDAAMAGYSGEIRVCLQNGGSSWTQLDVADTGLSITSLHLADFDGDGMEDIAVSFYDQGDILWYRNPLPGGSTWESTLIRQSALPREAAPGDIDGDGDADILCASEEEGVFICWNQDGIGSSWSVETVDALLPSGNAAMADMDNDGTMDVIVSGGEAGGIFVYTAPLWEKYTVVDSVGTIEDIAAGDLNGDGFTDIAAVSLTNFRTRTFENPGDLSDEWNSSTVGNTRSMCLIITDLDQDGDNDIVSSSPLLEHATVCLSSDAGVWLIYQSDLGTSGFSDMAVADIDGQAPPDLVGACYYQDRAVWCEGALLTTYYPSATISSSILHCDSLDQLFPLFLETDLQGTSIMRFRASDDPNAMGQWSEVLPEQIEEVTSLVEPGDIYCQYLVTLYAQGDFIPSTLYEIRLTTSPTGVEEQDAVPFIGVSRNPAPGAAELRFFLETPAAVSLTVYDIGGRAVREFSSSVYPPGEHALWLADLSPGLYLLRASVNGEPHSIKLVVTEGR